MSVDPEAGGAAISAEARIGVNNFFHAKLTSDLYDDRLSDLLDVLAPSAG